MNLISKIIFKMNIDDVVLLRILQALFLILIVICMRKRILNKLLDYANMKSIIIFIILFEDVP